MPQRQVPEQYELEESLAAAVVGKVKQGELSRAAGLLTASPVAPGTPETLAKLADPRRRPTQLFREFREADLQLQPEEQLQLDQRRFLENVRSAKRGSAPGRCGTRHEHYRALLENSNIADNLLNKKKGKRKQTKTQTNN